MKNNFEINLMRSFSFPLLVFSVGEQRNAELKRTGEFFFQQIGIDAINYDDTVDMLVEYSSTNL